MPLGIRSHPIWEKVLWAQMPSGIGRYLIPFDLSQLSPGSRPCLEPKTCQLYQVYVLVTGRANFHRYLPYYGRHNVPGHLSSAAKYIVFAMFWHPPSVRRSVSEWLVRTYPNHYNKLRYIHTYIHTHCAEYTWHVTHNDTLTIESEAAVYR